MPDHHSIKRSRWNPRPSPDLRTGLTQLNHLTHRKRIRSTNFGAQYTLVRSESELGRCQSLLSESFDGPGVKELVTTIQPAALMAIAFRDVNQTDTQCARQIIPRTSCCDLRHIRRP